MTKTEPRSAGSGGGRDKTQPTTTELLALIPSNWLDPLLSGPDSIIGYGPYTSGDIEALFLAVRQRIEQHFTTLSAREDGWQPIETAPKRAGEELLLLVKYRAGMPGKQLVGHYMGGGHCVEDHPPIAAGWYFWNGCMFDKAADPTHWMPLPKAPTAGEGYA